MNRRIYVDEKPGGRIPGDTEVYAVHDDGVRKWVELKTWREMAAWDRAATTLTHFVGGREVPGMREFANDLERTYYWPPGSLKNDLFAFHEGYWQGVWWLIASIPRKGERLAARVAEKKGLALFRGVPWGLSEAEFRERAPSWQEVRHKGEKFPMRSDRVHILEVADRGVKECVRTSGYAVSSLRPGRG